MSVSLNSYSLDSLKSKFLSQHYFLDNDTQNTLEDSMGGRIPDKYYVVTNSDLVKVRYLLVYAQDVQMAR